MININILSCSISNNYYPNWDKEKYPVTDYNIAFNSKDDIEWDCIMVSQNIPEEVHMKCRKGGLVYISGEPPLSTPCPHSFTKQFDSVVLPHPQVKHKNKLSHHGFLSWTLGRSFKTGEQRYDYKALMALEPEKTKLISVVSSNQRMMPGHNKRMSIIERLMNDYPNEVDIFGRGFKFVDFKADALLPYRFHICIENSSINDYWTEKISDPILAQCVPIYAGCSNINKYFGEDGYYRFDVDNYEGLKTIIDAIIKDSDSAYAKKKSALELMRKVLMEKENVVPFLINYVQSNKHNEVIDVAIKPLERCVGFRYQLAIIRLKRLIFKLFYKK